MWMDTHRVTSSLICVLQLFVGLSNAATTTYRVKAYACEGTFVFQEVDATTGKPIYVMDPPFSFTDQRTIEWNSAESMWECIKPSTDYVWAISDASPNFWELNDYDDITDPNVPTGITVDDITATAASLCVTAYACSGTYVFNGKYENYKPVYDMDPPFSDDDLREIYYSESSTRWECIRPNGATFAWSYASQNVLELNDYDPVTNDALGMLVRDCSPEPWELVGKGFNLFNNDLSGSPILDLDSMESNIKTSTTLGSSCSYQSVEFTSSFSSYQEYATAESASIGAGFSAGTVEAGGSLSVERKEIRSDILSTRSQIFTLDLKCSVEEVTIDGYNDLYFDSDFVSSLVILPQSYTEGDDLEDFIDFWDKYGTHMLVTAQLGGSIHGALLADSCEIVEAFGESSKFEPCLNAAYKGVTVEGCVGNEDSSYSSETVTNSVKNTKIIVKGGDSSQFTKIFSAFSDKTSDFQFWINTLDDSPDVIGGNVNEIHDVIPKVITLGNHHLNRGLTNNISDDVYGAIADAMKAAYTQYALQLVEQDTVFSDTECSIDCVVGDVNTEKCICDNCRAPCCSAADVGAPLKIAPIVYLFPMLLFFSMIK